MRRRSSRSWALVLAAVLGPLPARALEPQAGGLGEWSNLSGLRAGHRMEVKTKDKKTHSGRFVAYSEEAISLRKGKRELGFARDEVLSVLVLSPPRRRKAALIGFGLGAAAGFPLALMAAMTGPQDATTAEAAAVFFGAEGFYGAIGALIGATVARPTKTLIYQALAAQASGGSLREANAPPAVPRPATSLDSLPPPMREVYRVFSTERAAGEVARELAGEGAAAKEKLR